MDKEQKKKNNMPRFNLNWLYIAIIAGLAFMMFQSNGEGGNSFNKEVSYTAFKNYVAKGYTKDITVNKTDGIVRMVVEPQYIRDVFKAGTDRTGKSPTVSTRYPSTDKVEDFLESQEYKGTVRYEESDKFWLGLLTSLLPIILLVGLWVFFMKRMNGGGGNGGGIFSVGKSKARLFEKGSGLHITFKDVAGQEGAKQEVQEIVDFLKNPQKYTELGGKIPKGALLVGPPGTGKTLLAKAVAGEADVPFFSMSGSDFVEMFVGVGASRVRDLFHQAKEKAPCIIFIDEIDAVGRARGKNPAFGGNDERENTLNQLLTEMDGFGTNSGVIILAATNRVDILDKALLRAGRFDRQIHVDLPDLPERVAIFKVHLAPLKLDEGLDIDLLARQTPGFSGADIANVCNEAALIAARHNRANVGKQDFLDAVDRIIGGLEKKTKVMTAEEKRTIAIHEAGHASVSWMLKYANPLVKVTIVPRGQALGAAWYLPEERNITTKEQMLDEICATLGGRAAEELFTGHISSGALNDLETVTKRAYGMVAYLGMSDELSNLCYYNNQEYSFTKPYSEKTAEKIDSEVKKLINEQYTRAKAILSEHASKHAELAEILINKEVIFTEDVEKIFGKRPWKSRADELLEDEKKDTIIFDEAHTSNTLEVASEPIVETKEETTHE
ncbi:MAG: ATP-dependent zinc metalloprotease FtsH [Bacteroidaceae bacterium]|nr:ATP-dependent zinc metalloprotease FtsH [Bacteroidaceae bacterium]MBR2863576.1 ATP-dependent zinc metalloprotease FtsH [Bacteroidaceae bacterium]